MTLPAVPPKERLSSDFFDLMEQRNQEARDAKPDQFVWIDVTQAWEGFESLWRAYERYATDPAAGRRPGEREVCYTFAAIHNGFAPNHFMFNECSYFEREFVEISDASAGTADVGLIQHRIARGGYQLWHAFVPIPGTEWVMHKEGTQELRIVPRAEAWRTYGSSDGTASIRYLHRRETLKHPSRVIGDHTVLRNSECAECARTQSSRSSQLTGPRQPPLQCVCTRSIGRSESICSIVKGKEFRRRFV